MGRTVFIEDSIEENISKLYRVTKWATGILIGQTSPQRHYVIHLALTPLQQNNEEADEIEELGSEVNKQKSLPKTSAVQEFDEDWFVQHCRQVNRMLTGGLKILGIFVFGPPEKRNNLQVKFRQVLFTVHKMILSDLPLDKFKLDNGTSDQVILQVCSATKKTTCVSLDVSDNKASVNPADFKYQNFVWKWNALSCSVCLQLKFAIDRKSKKGTYSNLKTGVLPMLSKIANSLGAVNDVLMSDDKLLVNEKQLKNTGKNSFTTKSQGHKINLYLTEKDFEPFIERNHVAEQVLLVGTFESKAYVHPKATVKDAVNAIKCDVIRSLMTRCQLLCEDIVEETLQGNEDEGSRNNRTRMLPKRIFAPICKGALAVSDYIFKDEEPKDVLSRFSELLGVSVSEEDLLSQEKFSEQDDIADLLEDIEYQTDQNALKGKEAGQGSSVTQHFIGAVLGVVTVALAAAVTFFWGDS